MRTIYICSLLALASEATERNLTEKEFENALKSLGYDSRKAQCLIEAQVSIGNMARRDGELFLTNAGVTLTRNIYVEVSRQARIANAQQTSAQERDKSS